MRWSGHVVGIVICFLFTIHGVIPRVWHHGGVPMGVKSDTCDNAKWNLRIDWDDSTDEAYTCHKGDRQIRPNKRIEPIEKCTDRNLLPDPLHICMDKPITYTEDPPTAGPHRPLWPVYGEYKYIPPQRWLHSIEHGAAVFLYHPCADQMQINIFKNIANSCLRRHIITPYRNLTTLRPFAIITFGCKLLMSQVQVEPAENFIRTHALRGLERVASDGQYSTSLIEKAACASDFIDTHLCPPPDWVPEYADPECEEDDVD